ncbi:fimbrial protein [Mixta intestinalis]|uniref:Type-1 fimbrial protein, A chain n=1 Tax=Mixta intestinalis TaxID=1615494 RepID=A0A6P1PY70_9GAMM|nr:fimbrial protein [Mixta intestinalis]QHM71546.1 Type-1 fimbrial protein, A chain [Mixta intestinalis]
MRKLNAISLGLLLAASSAAFAGNDGVVHFRGQVTEPTCAVVSAEQTVQLDTIGAADLLSVNVGQSIEKGSKQFNINVNCEAGNLQDHVVMTMKGDASSQQVNALSNSSDKNNGIGLEVIDVNNNQILKPNEPIPASTLFNVLNKGDDNLTMTVRYTRLAEEVKGGDVASDVSFVSEYR